MQFLDTPVSGAFILEPDAYPDERGAVSVGFLARALEARGLHAAIAQVNTSYNPRRGTLRGLHAQRAPYEEVKIVSCVRGAVFDVAVDLRPDSPTFRRWAGVELTPKNRRALYVPAGCAHGFQTLEDESDVLYLVSQYYTPSHHRGVRWNDPAFGIAWPDASPRLLNDRDANYPDFR